MTILEVCAELRADNKVYVLIRMTRQTFFDYVKKIEAGTAKPSTIKEFFGKFGYEGSFNEWSKNGRPVAVRTHQPQQL